MTFSFFLICVSPRLIKSEKQGTRRQLLGKEKHERSMRLPKLSCHQRVCKPSLEEGFVILGGEADLARVTQDDRYHSCVCCCQQVVSLAERLETAETDTWLAQGHVQSPNTSPGFDMFARNDVQRGFKVRFLPIGGCVRGVAQSAVTCIQTMQWTQWIEVLYRCSSCRSVLAPVDAATPDGKIRSTSNASTKYLSRI